MRTGGSHISNDRMRVKRKNEYAGKGLGEHWSPPLLYRHFANTSWHCHAPSDLPDQGERVETPLHPGELLPNVRSRWEAQILKHQGAPVREDGGSDTLFRTSGQAPKNPPRAFKLLPLNKTSARFRS